MWNVQDALHVSKEAAQNGSLRDEMFRRALAAQMQIADALKKQAIALAQESEALYLLFEGDVDKFMAKYSESMDSTRQSIQSAAEWTGTVNSANLYDSYESAFQKIAHADHSFSSRNPSGFGGLFSRISEFVKNSDRLISRSGEAARHAADSVREKWVSAGDALAGLAMSLGEIGRTVGMGLRNTAFSAKEAVTDMAAMSKTITRSATSPLVDATRAIFRHAKGALESGVDTVARRQADRYWNALLLAVGDVRLEQKDDRQNLAESMRKGLSELERQFSHFGYQDIAITNDGGNIADHAFMIAEKITQNAESPDQVAIARARLESIRATLDLIARYSGRVGMEDINTNLVTKDQRQKIVDAVNCQIALLGSADTQAASLKNRLRM